MQKSQAPHHPWVGKVSVLVVMTRDLRTAEQHLLRPWRGLRPILLHHLRHGRARAIPSARTVHSEAVSMAGKNADAAERCLALFLRSPRTTRTSKKTEFTNVRSVQIPSSPNTIGSGMRRLCICLWRNGYAARWVLRHWILSQARLSAHIAVPQSQQKITLNHTTTDNVWTKDSRDGRSTVKITYGNIFDSYTN